MAQKTWSAAISVSGESLSEALSAVSMGRAYEWERWVCYETMWPEVLIGVEGKVILGSVMLGLESLLIDSVWDQKFDLCWQTNITAHMKGKRWFFK